MINSKNGILGLAIGDAMGVPVEFMKRDYLIQNPLTNMVGGGSHGMPKGSWSDDSSMTFATIDAIIKVKDVNTLTIAENFLKWIRKAEFTPTGRVFDIGRTTLQALAKIELKVDLPENAGGDKELDNGNGSLMRILPIAYFCYAKKYNEQEILEVVEKVSSITHRHEISIMGCYIYVIFAIELLKGKNLKEAYKKIKKINFSRFSSNCVSRYDRILNNDIKKYDLDNIKSTGYIVDTLEATLWVLFNTKNYNQAIIGAINLGNDTDTVGACVGGLAGIFYGIETANREWKESLLKYDYILELCENFDILLNKEC